MLILGEEELPVGAACFSLLVINSGTGSHTLGLCTRKAEVL